MKQQLRWKQKVTAIPKTTLLDASQRPGYVKPLNNVNDILHGTDALLAGPYIAILDLGFSRMHTKDDDGALLHDFESFATVVAKLFVTHYKMITRQRHRRINTAFKHIDRSSSNSRPRVAPRGFDQDVYVDSNCTRLFFRECAISIVGCNQWL